MSRSTDDTSLRVAAIAVAIGVLLGGLFWLLSGLGAPAGPGAEPAGEPDDAPLLGPQEPATPPAESAEEEENEEASSVVEDAQAAAGTRLGLQLYLASSGSPELVPRIRRIEAPDHPAARAQLALQALIEAGEPGYVSPLPPTTVIREVWVDVDNGVAYVDFARGFREALGGGSRSEIHAVYGVVGTLTGTFPEIAAVQFLLDGGPIDTLTGHLDLSRPISRSSDWLR